MSRSSNWCLTSEYVISVDKYEFKTLPAGAFVKPLELCYVPAHILNDKRNQSFNPMLEVFVYCRYGIVPVLKHLLREV